jgi:hypothetical protein
VQVAPQSLCVCAAESSSRLRTPLETVQPFLRFFLIISLDSQHLAGKVGKINFSKIASGADDNPRACLLLGRTARRDVHLAVATSALAIKSIAVLREDFHESEYSNSVV